MGRWTLRSFSTAILGIALPALALAQPPHEPARRLPPIPPPPPRPHVAPDHCPYRAATPYNAIFVGRPIPHPALNMPNFVLCCDYSNINPAPYIAPPCGCGWGGNRGGCDSGCDHGCGSIFGRFNFGGGCNNDCNTSCHSCDRGFSNWQRWSCGSNQCGCTSSCGQSNTGCKSCTTNCGCSTTPAPAIAPMAPRAVPSSHVKPVAGVQQVGWFLRTTDPKSPVSDCLSCPQTGPKPKHVLPTASSLSCTGCSTWESEAVFIWGSCRQFWTEPTYKWLHGKKP